MKTRTTRRTRLKSSDLRTPDQARQWLRDNGISAAQFARDNALSIDAVKDVLAGRSKANYGQAHLAAVALGIKAKPRNPAVSPVSARGA